ncbi:MAG: DHHA1 domain-containing protein [Candidatus Nanoarchaeia archaeon]
MFDLLENAAKWIKESRPESTVILYHAGCGDGIASAAILLKTYLELFGERPKVIEASPNRLNKINVNKINVHKYIIFADISADAWKDQTLKLAEQSKILVLDHHALTEDLNRYGILHVHPQFFSKLPGTRYPGAKLVYDVCSKIFDCSGFAWLAAVGIVNDLAGEAWKEFLDFVFEKWPELGQKSYGFESKLGFIASVLNAGQDVKQGDKKALELCIKAERPADILEKKYSEAKLLTKIREERRAEIDYYVQNWKRIAVLHPKEKLVWLYLKPKHKIAFSVATILAQQRPDLLFIVLNEEANRIKISFRQAKGLIDCSKLAKAATEPFGGRGGGHPEAAGGTVRPKDLDAFKQKVLELLRQNNF